MSYNGSSENKMVGIFRCLLLEWCPMKMLLMVGWVVSTTLQLLLLLCREIAAPSHDAASQDTFNSTFVEVCLSI